MLAREDNPFLMLIAVQGFSFGYVIQQRGWNQLLSIFLQHRIDTNNNS